MDNLLKQLGPQFQPISFAKVKSFSNLDGTFARYYEAICQKDSIGTVIYTGGLGQNLEVDLENTRTLLDMQLNVFILERFGESGSGRYYPLPEDYQKPAAIHPRVYARHLLDFAENVASAHKKPVYLLASCYGCLVGLHALLLAESPLFHRAFFISPMFGNHFLEKIGGIETILTWDITGLENHYYGKARDWAWDIAEKRMLNDPSTSDKLRGPLIDLWRLHRPHLRIGGFTYARIKVTAQGLYDLWQSPLEQIMTPVTLISPTEEYFNLLSGHALAAKRLPYAEHFYITGAKHGLLRERDEYRDQVFDIIRQHLPKE